MKIRIKTSKPVKGKSLKAYFRVPGITPINSTKKPSRKPKRKIMLYNPNRTA
tara:strand:- start:428 stop:583 length:156 start_codon:yes stop_codon:yes gene_type:complete